MHYQLPEVTLREWNDSLEEISDDIQKNDSQHDFAQEVLKLRLLAKAIRDNSWNH